MDSAVPTLAHRFSAANRHLAAHIPRNGDSGKAFEILDGIAHHPRLLLDDLFDTRSSNRNSKRTQNSGDLSPMTTATPTPLSAALSDKRESDSTMTSERRQILEMLSAGKISADEAERLLQLTSGGSASTGSSAATAVTTTVAQILDPKFIRVIVEPDPTASGNHARHHVNVRVPLKIIRAGVNLASLIPNDAGSMVQDSLLNKGYKGDLSKLDASALDELIEALQELSIDATVDNHLVKVFVE
jgi:hypothetical protein